MTAPDPARDPQDGSERPLSPALRRGWRRRCPACGDGPLLSGYLKVQDACPACGAAYHHHRADDGPAYLTILVVGHLMAPVLHLSYVHFEPDPLTLALVLGLGVTVASLWLLPRIKGAFVALQWAKRMHGFADPSPEAATDAGLR